MTKQIANKEAIESHLRAWIAAGIAWSKAELLELEHIYKVQAPAWAKKQGKKLAGTVFQKPLSEQK